jgi:Ca-activated chloride channel family protein
MMWGAPERLILLWALLPVAWLVFALARRRQRRLALVAEASMLPRLLTGQHERRTFWRAVLWLAAVGCLGLSLARPQWGEHWEEVHRRGLDLIVALDTSKSMLARDLKPNRMEQAKWGIRDLVLRLKGDRIGLIAFAGTSFLQCPLTIDYSAFMMSLDDTYIGIIPRGGTAISHALETAANSFDPDSNADRVVLLITDGEDHEGTPVEMLPELKEKNIRVFTIGVGSQEGELIPVTERNGRVSFLKDRDGNVVKSSLSEAPLQTLALQTGGAYVRAGAGDFGVEQILNQGMAELKRDESEGRRMRTFQDRYGWFVGTALVLLAIEAAIGPGPYRRKEVSS